jgi:predicted transposase YbfD/YdcC
MKYTPLSFDVNLTEGFAFEVNSLFAVLCELHDQRDARGLRYALVTVLVFVVLSKLSGEDSLRGIAQWVELRKEVLAQALCLVKPQAPHATTYSRILKDAVQVKELEQVVRQFFAVQPGAGQSVVISLDGKTIRGTIPAGKSHGVHLLAAYLPEEGWVLLQVRVEEQENEIPAALRVVKALDLRGKIVTGDALLAQRELSTAIVEKGGHYIWTIKENQPQTQQDIQALFEPEACTPGFSPCHKDFRTSRTVGKGHGRLEKRTLTASSMLSEYVDWPYVQQVFRLERHFVRLRDGKVMEEVTYGVTSLPNTQASAAQLLSYNRTHWGIENGLHYRRDDSLHEDRCCVRDRGAQAMAVINNLILGLLRHCSFETVPDARRYYDANLDQAVALILQSPP